VQRRLLVAELCRVEETDAPAAALGGRRFSAADVYAIAISFAASAVVRRCHGCASPRTRNAQVELYESGEVDYLVATDAIAWVSHGREACRLASLRKFDGEIPRPLPKAEIAQIPGALGDTLTDGTFGTTIDVGPMDERSSRRWRNHRFESAAAGSDVAQLVARLPQRPHVARELAGAAAVEGLIRQGAAEDHQALESPDQGSGAPELAGSGASGVALLWKSARCRTSQADGRRAYPSLSQLYRHLTTDSPVGASLGGRLPEQWIADQITRLDRTDGDIDQLTGRIAISAPGATSRTAPMVNEPGSLAGRFAQMVEDRLSEALHQR